MLLCKPLGGAWPIPDKNPGSHTLLPHTPYKASFYASWFIFHQNDSLQVWLWVAMVTDLASTPPDFWLRFHCSVNSIWLHLWVSGQIFKTRNLIDSSLNIYLLQFQQDMNRRAVYRVKTSVPRPSHISGPMGRITVSLYQPNKHFWEQKVE